MTETTKNRGGRRSWVPPDERMTGKNVALAPRHLAWLKAEAAARRVPESLLVREALDAAMGQGKTEATLLGERASALAEAGLQRAERLVIEAAEAIHLVFAQCDLEMRQKLLALEQIKHSVRKGEEG